MLRYRAGLRRLPDNMRCCAQPLCYDLTLTATSSLGRIGTSSSEKPGCVRRHLKNVLNTSLHCSLQTPLLTCNRCSRTPAYTVHMGIQAMQHSDAAKQPGRLHGAPGAPRESGDGALSSLHQRACMLGWKGCGRRCCMPALTGLDGSSKSTQLPSAPAAS